MATATITYTNVKQGVEADGFRSVEGTIVFSTPGTDTYATNGIDLNLANIGLTRLRKAYEVKLGTSVSGSFEDNFITLAAWKTSQATTTFNWFVDTATNGTSAAPLLVIYQAGAEKTNAQAIAASWSGAIRIKLVGTA